jgi:glycosyltransferase involved in cell wall biosynthesis
MKILLVGNYPYLKSQSMDRFAGMIETGMKAAGHQIRLLKPPPVIGRILPSATGVGKWLGYLDRFILFRPSFKRAADWADVVHICDNANAVYVPWLEGKPHVVTCHDMLAIRSALGEIRHQQTGPTGRVYQRWILAGLKEAQHVACVSETTREDLLRLAGIAPDRVSVIRNGFNYPYRPMSVEESICQLKQTGLGDVRPYFLHMGGNFWYKNRIGLLRIFAQLTRLDGGRSYHLLLAGDGTNGQLGVLSNKLGISEEIKSAHNVTDEQLRALYSVAEGLIFPSLAEGFGWPIIEAQACGCPVFTSNRKPMTEVGGDGAVYFDPLDEAGAAEIILQAIYNKDHMRQRGFRNAMKYSTLAMTEAYVRAYLQVAT